MVGEDGLSLLTWLFALAGVLASMTATIGGVLTSWDQGVMIFVWIPSFIFYFWLLGRYELG